MVHLHVRDPQGVGIQDAHLFKEVIRMIRNECDVIINVTTGGGPGISTKNRISIVPRFLPTLHRDRRWLL